MIRVVSGQMAYAWDPSADFVEVTQTFTHEAVCPFNQLSAGVQQQLLERLDRATEKTPTVFASITLLDRGNDLVEAQVDFGQKGFDRSSACHQLASVIMTAVKNMPVIAATAGDAARDFRARGDTQ